MRFLFFFVLFFSNSVTCDELSNSPEINKIFTTFFQSIQNKDKKSFLALFHPEHVSWIGVYSDESIEILRSRYSK